MLGLITLIGYLLIVFFHIYNVFILLKDQLMDKELKPPYLPPKDKIISDHEIEKQAIMEKLVIEEIKVI